jgi:uncharacterized protein (TIGR02266 family)
MSDTRKDKRAPVSLKVRFKSATVDEFIEHYCKDVSRGGIFIKSSQPMPVGTLLKFQFQLKDESQLIKGVGRVVWTRNEERAGPDRPSGMGIKFIKMDNESRVMVDRIIAGSEDGGAFEEGRETDVADSVTPPPVSGGDSGFFPAGAAELPPPEDRTAVRQAAEFLAAAFSEVSDEAAAKEAEEKAVEARVRTQQIDAQRVAEAEQQRKAPGEALPSMIIDPGLSGPPSARSSDRPTAELLNAAPERPVVAPPPKPSPLPPPPKVALPPMAPPPAPAVPKVASPSVGSTPSLAPPAEKRSPLLPILAIAAVLGVAAFVSMRGGPEAAQETPASAVDAPKPSEPAPAPEPSAPQPQAVEPTPAPSEPTPSVEPIPEPVEPVAPAEMVAIRVSTQPPGAEVSVDGVVKGVAPVVLELAKGTSVTLAAGLPTYAKSTQEITPESDKTVRFALKVLPFVLHVETTPPGAAVLVTGKRGVSPVDLTWTVPPKAALKATAKLAGYQNAEAPVPLESFAQGEDAMRATIQLPLEPVPEKPVAAPAPVAPVPAAPRAKPAAIKPKPEAAPSEASAPAPAEPKPEAPKPAEPAPAPKAEEPTPEPAPAPKVEEPKPEPPKAEPKPEPKPAEQLPDNPFG